MLLHITMMCLDVPDSFCGNCFSTSPLLLKFGQVGSTAQPVQRPVQPVQSSARTPSQVADDEALARRLQEQLLALVGSVEGWT